jgi:hypothetical protein
LAEALQKKNLDFKEAFALANTMAEEETQFKVHTFTRKGIEVAPYGFEKIQIVNRGNFFLSVDYDSFRVKDLTDSFNEPTCIPSSTGKKKAVNHFYRWVKDNQRWLEASDRTYQEVVSAMRKEGIDYRSYCAID